jgi:mannose-6-phosphate isomerase-like protein (cupin superfamily)
MEARLMRSSSLHSGFARLGRLFLAALGARTVAGAHTSTQEVGVAGVEKRDFDSPDESRTPDKTRVDTVHLGGTSAARLTMESGWRWSECVKPVAGTESCEHRHVGIVQSGRMRVIHDDGTELEIGPGDVYVIEPGHDAEVVGDDRFIGFEFQPKAAEEYAR